MNLIIFDPHISLPSWLDKLILSYCAIGIILRIKNKFVEIVAAEECYLTENNVNNIEGAAVRNMSSIWARWL